MTIRYSRPEYNGTIVYLIAMDAVEYARATRDRVPTGLPDLEKFLALPGTDDVLVSENFARRHNVKVGDTITLPGPNGPVTSARHRHRARLLVEPRDDLHGPHAATPNSSATT